LENDVRENKLIPLRLVLIGRQNNFFARGSQASRYLLYSAVYHIVDFKEYPNYIITRSSQNVSGPNEYL